MIRSLSLAILLLLVDTTSNALAGGLDAPGTPTSGSGMPSTADIYSRLDTGAAIAVPGAFQEPAAGPTAGTGRTLAEIGAKLPIPDNTNGATASEVAAGKTFWGLRTDGTWGLTSGTIATGANVTGGNGLLTFAIPNGLYSGAKTATAMDSNLVAGNIKSGVSIFGVSGTASQASGTAAAADVLAGKTFSNSGATGINGTMANNGAVNITPGTTPQTIAVGYHNGSGSVAGDANLVAGNIRSGASIFGVSGTAAVASGTAVAGDVLSGRTFSNGSATGVAGTMPEIGALAITPGTTAQPIPAGYHNGSGSVAGDANLVPGKILSGATIFGVTGTLSALDMSHVANLTCASHWAGATCNVCAGLWTGANCDVCPAGWSGANCDIIARPFPTALPDYATTPWKCVHDSATGLTWEVKNTAGGLHDRSNTYTWYSSTDWDPNLGINPGTPSGGNCNGSGCDTEKFVAAVNAEQLCGYADWRAPSAVELTALISGTVSGPPSGWVPLIDNAYYPNSLRNYYWSGSSDPTDLTYLKALIGDFAYGTTTRDSKNVAHPVRVVRGP